MGWTFTLDQTRRELIAERNGTRTFEMAWDKLERMAESLRPVLESSPEELADALGKQAELYEERLAILLRQVRRAHTVMSNAAAAHEAAQVATRKEG